jgi:NDP-sugar pyrophosphorylase family protein
MSRSDAASTAANGAVCVTDTPSTTPPVHEIPVVILCGGMGTRLREMMESIPKPLVDIGEQPIPAHHEGVRPLHVPALHPPPGLESDEKPTKAEGLVSGGVFVLERDFLLDDDPGLLFEQARLQKTARDGELAVFVHEGFWTGMDTYREYTTLNEMWGRGEAPWKAW